MAGARLAKFDDMWDSVDPVECFTNSVEILY